MKTSIQLVKTAIHYATQTKITVRLNWIRLNLKYQRGLGKIEIRSKFLSELMITSMGTGPKKSKDN